MKKVVTNFIYFVLLISLFFYGSYNVFATSISALDVEVTGNKVDFSWSSGELSMGCIKYGLGNEYENSLCEVEYGFQHSISVTNLLPNSVYRYKIISKEKGGEYETFSGIFETKGFYDATRPLLTKINNEYVGSKIVLIKFRTSEITRARIEFGRDMRMKSRIYSSYSMYTQDHEVVIKNLKPDTKYYYKIIARDRNKNEFESVVYSFTTKSESEINDYAPLKILEISPLYNNEDVGYNEAVISWRTNKPAKAYIRYGTNIKRLSEKIEIPGYNTESYIRLTNLRPNQTYYYQITFKDIVKKKTKFPTDGYFSFQTLGSKSAVQKIVKGANTVQQMRMVKSIRSPYVYMLINGMKHRLRTDDVLSSYGFSIKDVEIVNFVDLDIYPDVRLVKTPESSTVYYINPEKGIKIAIPNKEILGSYTDNFSNIVTITKEDLDSFKDAKLVEQNNVPVVYLLQGNTVRPFYTNEVLKYEGYSLDDVIKISNKHFMFYNQGPLIR